MPKGVSLNQKDLKRYKKMLEDSKTALLQSAKKTLMEESNFDTNDLPLDSISNTIERNVRKRINDPLPEKMKAKRGVLT